jgi:predicted DNA-binding protein (UPF0278 family)
MDIVMIEEIGIVTIGAIALGVAYWKNQNFRNMVNSYVKKAYRENKEYIFLYADAHLTDVLTDLKVDIKASTHKYIKNEVLRQAIDEKVNNGLDVTDEWVKRKYKEILEELMKE